MMIFATVVLGFLLLIALLLFFASYGARKLQAQRHAEQDATEGRASGPGTRNE